MRVDESRPWPVAIIGHRVDRVVRVRIGGGRQSRQECQHRSSRAQTVQHESAIVSGASCRCQASTAAARYNAAMIAIRRTAAMLLATAALAAAPTLLCAHEVTHNGTVVALKTARYAQPNGGTREVRELEVAVVDPKTKRVANRVFTITEKTKITRAGKPVTTADVTAQKDEKVAVVVDHDRPGDEAIAVRLEAAQ